ncbi:hypothetical protein QZH41_013918, partial [Actinostola sp. cb2023]
MKRGWPTLGLVPCYVIGITCGACSTVVIVTLALMSVKLYRAIEQDFGNHVESTSSRRSNLIKFGAIWVVSGGIFLPTCLGWNSIVPDGPHCSPNWRVRSILDASYLIVMAIVSFLVPIAVFLLYLFKMTRYIVRHRPHEGCTMHEVRARALHMESKKFIGVLALVFVVLWLPYWFDGFLTMFDCTEVKKGDLAILPWICISVSMVYFPIMYIALNKRFRHHLMSLIGCKKGQQINPMIAVDKTETFDVLPSSDGVTPRGGSPSILVP